MFRDVVESFKRALRDGGERHALLFINGLHTQVIVTYRPSGEMLIERLPADLPPTLLLGSDAVYTDRWGKQPVKDAEEASFYRLYGVWDPRVLAAAEPKEDPEPQRGRWRLRYDLRHVPNLAQEVVDRIVAMTNPIREVEYVFDGDLDRLLELSQWDLDGSANRLNLVFQYQ